MTNETSPYFIQDELPLGVVKEPPITPPPDVPQTSLPAPESVVDPYLPPTSQYGKTQPPPHLNTASTWKKPDELITRGIRVYQWITLSLYIFSILFVLRKVVIDLTTGDEFLYGIVALLGSMILGFLVAGAAPVIVSMNLKKSSNSTRKALTTVSLVSFFVLYFLGKV